MGKTKPLGLRGDRSGVRKRQIWIVCEVQKPYWQTLEIKNLNADNSKNRLKELDTFVSFAWGLVRIVVMKDLVSLHD